MSPTNLLQGPVDHFQEKQLHCGTQFFTGELRDVHHSMCPHVSPASQAMLPFVVCRHQILGVAASGFALLLCKKSPQLSVYIYSVDSIICCKCRGALHHARRTQFGATS